MITTRNVHLKDAHKTPQFWLIWAVLCLNVSAGIGVLAVASPMLQEIFGGSLIGADGVKIAALNASQKASIATVAAGFVGMLSLFNIAGRFVWASFSDKIGRKLTYATFFALGIFLYAASPWAAHSGNQALFVLFMCIILSMYGGGFATVPAYLADMFGPRFVGAIHGRLLTAWSTAGVVGTMVITQIRDAQLSAGIPPDLVYDRTLYILAGFLVVGFLCNLMIRPVAEKWYTTDAPVAVAIAGTSGSHGIGRGGLSLPALLAWAAVGLPLAWGVWRTLTKALALFH